MAVVTLLIALELSMVKFADVGVCLDTALLAARKQVAHKLYGEAIVRYRRDASVE